MNTEQLIEELRRKDYLFDLSATVMGPGVLYRYASRFWRLRDHQHVDFEYTNTIDEAIRAAAITIRQRDDLEIEVPPTGVPTEQPLDFFVWAYGILWGIGITLGIQILMEALR